MEALEALDRSIAINGYHKAYFTRAILHQSTGKPDLALADIEHVLAVQPRNPRALCIRGDCQERMGNDAAALESFNKAIEYDDKEPLFYMKRGMLFSKMKQHQLAIGDLDLAIELNPGSGEAYYCRGMIKQQAGQGPCQDLENALRRRYGRAREAMDRYCRRL